VHHRPKKALGQNFLVDGNLQRKIVEALDLEPQDQVLEIGPGKGALTRHMAGVCRSLILVELDRDLAEELEREYEDVGEVRVIQGDILRLHPRELTPEVPRLKVVGNIPYNITSPILFHLLEPPRPREILLMVQKEVGERILGMPGTSAYGALTVGVQTVAEARRVLKVPRSAFRPVPAVESMVIRIRPFFPVPLSASEEADLRTLTRIAFQQRRKQFQSILRNHPDLALSHEEVGTLEKATGFDLRKRPETFSPGDFITLSKALQAIPGPKARESKLE
jgi:16S rRNA (adenine1518-N6/adenine1519-N6)-dimethyltransferase